MSQSRFPTTDTGVQSAADFILNGAQELKPIYNPNTGKDELTVMVNSKQIQWMSQTVTSNRLGDLATELEKLESMAEEQAKYNMSSERAEYFKNMIRGYCQAVRYGINAKSSETTRDNKNPHNNVVQMFAKQPSPYIKEDDDMRARGLAGLFGGGGQHREEQ